MPQIPANIPGAYPVTSTSTHDPSTADVTVGGSTRLKESETGLSGSKTKGKEANRGPRGKSALPSHTLVSVGAGPRFTAAVRAELKFLENFADHFSQIQAMGGHYDIQTIGVDRKGPEFVGRGNAWGPNQGGGTANTAVEGSGLSNVKRLEAFYVANRDALAQLYESRGNMIAATTLETAFDPAHKLNVGDKVVTHRAVLARQELGQEEHDVFNAAVAEGQEKFPFYQAHTLTGLSVQAVDITDPQHPAARLADPNTGQSVDVVHADMLRLNTGTTLVNPIQDPKVQPHAFVQPMDPEALGTFLKQKGLLGEDGTVKQGTRLALGGSGLSAYDEAIAVLAHMPGLIEKDATSLVGYKVSDAGKQKYAGALTFVSNTPGKWVDPRHAYKANWTQKRDPMGTPDELHAAFLHQDGQEVFKGWREVEKASVAAAVDMTLPQAAREGMSTEQVLIEQMSGTRHHLGKLQEASTLSGPERQAKQDEASRTLEGAKRQAQQATILGVGMTRDIPGTIGDLAKKAPLTYKGRDGYLLERAQPHAVTMPGTETAANNKDLVRVHDEWLVTVGASPPLTHALAPLLFEAGVATYVAGSYHNFTAQDTGRALSLQAHDGSRAEFDAFIVAPTFKRGAEEALTSLSGQVQPVGPSLPDLPKVGANRRVIASDGTRAHVEDFSLNGTGDWASPTSKLGMSAFEVPNRDSATADAPRQAYMRMSVAHLVAAGFGNAQSIVDDLFSKRVPSDAAYANEVAKFEPAFDTLMHKAAFVPLAAQAAREDGAAFGKLIEKGATGSTVKMRAALLDPALGTNADGHRVPDPKAPRYTQAATTFSDGLADRQKFEPASKTAYFNRFVDSPEHVCKAVYEEAFKMARDKLASPRGI